MNDLPPGSRPLPPDDRPGPTPTQALPVEPGAEAHSEPPPGRLRDRVWSLRAVIAVALVSVIVGGLGGAALASLANGGDDDHGPGRFGRFDGGGPGAPPGMNRDPQDRWPGRQGGDQQGQGRPLPPGAPPVPMPTLRPSPSSALPSLPAPTPTR